MSSETLHTYSVCVSLVLSEDREVQRLVHSYRTMQWRENGDETIEKLRAGSLVSNDSRSKWIASRIRSKADSRAPSVVPRVLDPASRPIPHRAMGSISVYRQRLSPTNSGWCGTATASAPRSWVSAIPDRTSGLCVSVLRGCPRVADDIHVDEQHPP